MDTYLNLIMILQQGAAANCSLSIRQIDRATILAVVEVTIKFIMSALSSATIFTATFRNVTKYHSARIFYRINSSKKFSSRQKISRCVRKSFTGDFPTFHPKFLPRVLFRSSRLPTFVERNSRYIIPRSTHRPSLSPDIKTTAIILFSERRDHCVVFASTHPRLCLISRVR